MLFFVISPKVQYVLFMYINIVTIMSLLHQIISTSTCGIPHVQAQEIT